MSSFIKSQNENQRKRGGGVERLASTSARIYFYMEN